MKQSVSSLRNTLDLNNSAITRRNCLEAGARWHWLGQEVNVHLIHCGKVLHVREIDIIFDYLFERRTGKLENFLEVL
jgi:hypothetical protein